MLVILFLVSFSLSALINWILIKFSFNFGVRNLSKEDEIRWQKKKPSVGGLSFYLVFLIIYAILSNLIFSGSWTFIKYDMKNDLSLIISCTIGFLIGLIDDAKNTNPLLKFSGQIICGIILTLFGIIIPISPNIVWNSIVTVLWVVFLMNSINMLDNMDGMTSLVSFFILAGIFSLLSINHLSLTALMVLVCSGAIFGFLIYNWNPSRIYMGDSGSQFLGIILAHFSIVFLWGNRMEFGGYFQLNQFFIPLMVFTIPIFDTATVFIHRLLRRQSPFVGGRDHLSHHLVYLGLKDSHSVLFLGIIHLLFVFSGIYIYYNLPQLIVSFFTLWVLTFMVIQYFYVKAKSLAPPIDPK
jgi:UDP-GlcNAc:undecaprenyl-phosphate/decaprenyl-phosphate GlcNAc-1-phosphate transferase